MASTRRPRRAAHSVPAPTNSLNKDEPTNEEEMKESTETNYDVEKVVGKKFDEDGSLFYLLKWKGWNGEPTWEPESNCGCEKLIEDYEKVIAKKQDRSKLKQAQSAPKKTPTKKKSISKPASPPKRSSSRRVR